MDADILERITGRSRLESLDAPTAAEAEPVDDFVAFGFLRGIRDRAQFLELRRKTGNITAIGYAWIEQVEFDPSVGITLHVLGQKIVIRGRNLNAEIRPNVRLFQSILRHRVPWIQEADEAMIMLPSGKEALIEQIQL